MSHIIKQEYINVTYHQTWIYLSHISSNMNILIISSIRTREKKYFVVLNIFKDMILSIFGLGPVGSEGSQGFLNK